MLSGSAQPSTCGPITIPPDQDDYLGDAQLG